MGSVLVLNATYQPLSTVSTRRAVVLLLKEKAELLEAAESRLRSANISLPVPLVIRLVYYVRVPNHFGIHLNRANVLLRDNYTCQYCGATPSRKELTIDHVVPRVLGGTTTWDNLVCACKPCNLKKGGRTPEQANMPLRKIPGEPRYMALVVAGSVEQPQVWDKYLAAWVTKMPSLN